MPGTEACALLFYTAIFTDHYNQDGLDGFHYAD